MAIAQETVHHLRTAGLAEVDPDIVWAKLASLAEGAGLASSELWCRLPQSVVPRSARWRAISGFTSER